MNPNEIAWVEIYPPIGIARLGNSPTEWYLGPEVPGRADVPQNGFKDSQQKIKRQAARFRVYAYDKTGKVLGELNQAEGFSLKWSVNVANTKASYYLFEGRLEGGFKHPKGLRNPNVQGDLPPEQRDRLNINPGVKTVQGAKAAPVSMTGQFWGSKDKPTDVYLGEIFTDERGRLMVLGGYGWSRSIGEEEYPPLMTDFDNEDWVDDTSDGWVDVVVEKNGRSWRPQYKSWVISSTPKYATGIYAPTTLFDLIENIMEERKRREQKERYDVGQVEYYSHVEPLLRRATLLSWVNIQANGGHGANGNGHFTSPEWQKHLSDPSPLGEQARKQVLGRLRMPETQDDRYKAERAGQAFPYFMPWLSGDGGRTTSGDPTTFTSLTQLQYERMVKWANGNFVVGKKPAPPPFNLEEIPLAQQPRALTEAHLEWCIGLPLFPGIEVSWPAEKEETYNPKTSFRIREDSRPGDMTKYLSLPWQSDFYMCRNYWWPSVRPDSILPQSELKKFEQGVSLKDLQRVPWERGLHVNYTDVFGDQPFFANTDMTKNWHQLGFIHPIEVTPKKGKPQIVYVEKERGTIHASERSRERAKREFLAVSGSLPKVTGKKGTLHSYNMPKRTPITTLESLKTHLQMAIQVELSTIPLYLFAMYSIDSPNQNDPRYVDPHVKAIRTVVSEEMLHLTLAGNVLLAIGGTPRLYDPEIVPIYPRAMQGHYPYLEMHLADLKANLATFIQIEYPKRPDSLPQAENYESLAQFYEAIEEGIKFLNKTGKGIFQNPRKEFQFAPGLGFNPTVVDGGGSIVVTDEATALKALEEIVIQGEGSDWGKQALGKEENHFTVFMNLVKDIGTDLKCYPVITDPITHEYKDPRIFQVSRTFDAAYCYLLLLIENLWQISELNQRRKLVFADLFGVMIGILAPLARMMVTLPIDENLRAAPAFNFYDFGPNPTLARAYQAVKTEMQAAIDAYLAVTEETSDQVTVHNYGPQIESLLTVQATLNRLQSDSASKL